MSRGRIASVFALAAVAGLFLSYPGPTYPGSNTGAQLNRAAPGCGLCHGSTPNAYGAIQIAVKCANSIQAGSTALATVTVTGGPSSAKGGFSADTDLGAFAAVSNSSVGNNGSAVSHTNSSTRTWAFRYGSTTPGLARLHLSGMGANGTGGTGGDSWGWYGPDTSQPGTPFRVFVNDTRVVPYGTPCPGSHGFSPIAGVAKNLTLGSPFTLELHNAPVGAAALGVLGFSQASWGGLPLPLDLGFLGAQGCSILASLDLVQVGLTSGSGKGGGTAAFAWPIPSDPIFSGVNLHLQVLVLDAGANALGLTATVGLKAAIQ